MHGDRRWVYLVGCTLLWRKRGLFHSERQVSGSAECHTPMPLTSADDVAQLHPVLAESLGLDIAGVRKLLVFGVSLLRVDVRRDQEWVSDEWQPWGPLSWAHAVSPGDTSTREATPRVARVLQFPVSRRSTS